VNVPLFTVALAGILGALIGGLATLAVVATIPNLKRITCRCCDGRLDQPGGCGVVGLGFGFCETCAARIKEKR